MPPKGSKRAAQTAAGPAKKKAAANPMLENCGIVADALAQADPAVLPAAVKNMLVPMVPTSLGEFKEKRHRYQSSVVTMVGEALNSMAACLERSLEEAKARVDGVEGDRAARQDALVTAQTQLGELQAATAAKKEAQALAAKADAEARESLAAAKGAQGAAEKAAAAVLERKAGVERAIADLFVLKETAAEGKVGKQATKTLADVSKAYCVDASMVESVMKTLKKDVLMRSSFDCYAVQSFHDALAKIVDGFDQELAASKATQEEHAASVHTAQDAADVTQQALAASEEALAAAKEEEKAGAAAVKSAQKSVKDWLHDTRIVMDDYDGIGKALAELREGALVAFEKESEKLVPAAELTPAAAEGAQETA